MKKLLAAIFLQVLSVSCLWGAPVDSLLNVLDAALINRHLYERKSASEYPLSATFLPIMEWIDAGFISDADETLTKIRPKLSSTAEKTDYYRCRIRQSEQMYRLHRTDTLGYKYSLKMQEYQDSICHLLPDGNAEKTFYTALSAMRRQEYGTALRLLESILPGSADNPLFLAHIYEKIAEAEMHLKNQESADRYLIMKAIVCVKNRIRDYSGLLDVAKMQMRQENFDAAHKYLDYAQQYAQTIASPILAVELNHALGELRKTDIQQKVTEKQRLYFFFSVLCVLSVILLFSIRKINKQMHVIADAKKKMEELYADLEKKKNDLEAANNELTVLTEELKTTNLKLSEASMLKEEYIGHFLEQCSKYLHKLQDYKKMVNRKIKAGQIEELYKQNSSNRLIHQESKELYQKFDIAFLKIFPKFVEQFNELLQPDERFVLSKDELLNTELRLFALVRLGIKDSSQIADFLGYSVTTIYTYRTRIKNKANGNREDFEKNVMKIGM